MLDKLVFPERRVKLDHLDLKVYQDQLDHQDRMAVMENSAKMVNLEK